MTSSRQFRLISVVFPVAMFFAQGILAQPLLAQKTTGVEAESSETDSRKLPQPTSLNTPLSEEEKAQSEVVYVGPEEKVKAAFAPPPNAKPISKSNLWVDLKQKRVYADGYVTMREGPLEMFACPIGSKEHESIIATLAQPSEVHAALLAIGTRSGTPVQFLPEFVPATGQRVRVWICYLDKDGNFKAADAKTWVQKTQTKKTLEIDWVFSGSGFWKDPNDGREYYRADGGDMICVSNFSTAMMDLPIASSAEANSLQFSPNTEAIPERGTAIRMVLTPIPIDTPVGSNKPEESNNDSQPSTAQQKAELSPPTREILPPTESIKPKSTKPEITKP